MSLRIVTWNLFNGGVDGHDAGRLHAQCDILNTLDPDLAVLTEAKDFHERGWERVWTVTNRLGLQPLLALSRSHGCHILVLYRSPTVCVERWDADAAGGQFHHALARARLRVEGIPGPVTLLATHLSPFSGEQRLREASWLAEYAAPGRYAILAGDLNTIGAEDPEPDWSQVPAHLRSRHVLIHPDGTFGPTDRRATRLLAQAGWIDPHTVLGQPPRPTVGHRPDTEGEPRRVDHVLLSPRPRPLGGRLRPGRHPRHPRTVRPPARPPRTRTTREVTTPPARTHTTVTTRHDPNPGNPLYGQPLTPFELWLLRATITGATQRRIARYLNLSRSTLQRRLRRVYRKLGVANRAQALEQGSQLGLIDLAQPHRFPDPGTLAADRRVAAAATMSCRRSHPRLPGTPYCVSCLVTAWEARHAHRPGTEQPSDGNRETDHGPRVRGCA